MQDSENFPHRHSCGSWYALNWVEDLIKEHQRRKLQADSLKDPLMGQIGNWGRMLRISFLPLIGKVYGFSSIEYLDAQRVQIAAMDCVAGREDGSNYPQEANHWTLIKDHLAALVEGQKVQTFELRKLSVRRERRATAQPETGNELFDKWQRGEPPHDGEAYAATGNIISTQEAFTSAIHFEDVVRWRHGCWENASGLSLIYHQGEEIFFHFHIAFPKGGLL
jgi:hypothetical protein